MRGERGRPTGGDKSVRNRGVTRLIPTNPDTRIALALLRDSRTVQAVGSVGPRTYPEVENADIFPHVKARDARSDYEIRVSMRGQAEELMRKAVALDASAETVPETGAKSI